MYKRIMPDSWYIAAICRGNNCRYRRAKYFEEMFYFLLIKQLLTRLYQPIGMVTAASKDSVAMIGSR